MLQRSARHERRTLLLKPSYSIDEKISGKADAVLQSKTAWQELDAVGSFRLLLHFDIVSLCTEAGRD